jgi:hypothetical protein
MPYKDKNNPKNIAYKKAYYKKTKAGRYKRIKHNIYKWRENHKDFYKALVKEYYWDNRKEILKKGENYRKENAEMLKLIDRIRTENLDDRYMYKHLIKMGFTRQMIRKNPDLVETYRTKLLLVRTIKNKQNGKK